jgi:predicted RNA-binding Zn-ribbon protein involved in translation (DUF1610 family)
MELLDLLELGELINMTIDDDSHRHCCPNCHTVWEHPDVVQLGPEPIFKRGHTCPNCGTQRVHRKYHGFRRATVRQTLEE